MIWRREKRVQEAESEIQQAFQDLQNTVDKRTHLLNNLLEKTIERVDDEHRVSSILP